MFKDPYMVIKRKVCLELNISIRVSLCGTRSIHASVHKFHNVSIHVKRPQKLVMIKNWRCPALRFLSFSCTATHLTNDGVVKTRKDVVISRSMRVRCTSASCLCFS